MACRRNMGKRFNPSPILFGGRGGAEVQHIIPSYYLKRVGCAWTLAWRRKSQAGASPPYRAGDRYILRMRPLARIAAQ